MRGRQWCASSPNRRRCAEGISSPAYLFAELARRGAGCFARKWRRAAGCDVCHAGSGQQSLPPAQSQPLARARFVPGTVWPLTCPGREQQMLARGRGSFRSSLSGVGSIPGKVQVFIRSMRRTVVPRDSAVRASYWKFTWFDSCL